ncbi:TolB family protein [Chloroflexota bacterium]
MRRFLWAGLLTLAAVVVFMGLPVSPSAAQSGNPATVSYDFSQDDGSWWTGETENGRVWIDSGALHVLNHTTATFYQGTNIQERYTNYTLDLDSWLAGGTDDNFHYIVLHYNDAENNHKFGFSADGYVTAESTINGEAIDWVSPARSDTVRLGADVINHARFDVTGPEIRFYLNDVLIAEINEPRLTEGMIQLASASFDGEYSDVAFDNVLIQDRTAPPPPDKGSGNVPPADNSSPTPRQLTFAGVKTLDPEWSPDGQRIVFYSDIDGDREIFVMNAAGSNQQQLTNNTAPEYFPSWSPDGRQIVYISDQTGGFDIVVMDADGSSARNLGLKGSEEWFPLWSHDGSQLVFASDRSSDLDIYTMDLTGNNLQQLTASTNVWDYTEDVAPGSGEILFQSYQDDIGNYYAMDAAGGNVRQLTNDATAKGSAAWSPDGTKIVFSAGTSEQLDLFILDLTSNALTQLTDTVGGEWYPDWSPDGRQIIYAAEGYEADVSEIYILDLADHTSAGSTPVTANTGPSNTLEIDMAFESLLAELTAPGEFTIMDEDNNGQPDSYMYTTREAPANGQELMQAVTFYPENNSGRIALIFMSDTAQPQQMSYTLDIPKSFAAHVDDLAFSHTPTQIIDPDPVVMFNMSSDSEDNVILLESNSVQADGDDVTTVLHVLQGFQYERVRRHCIAEDPTSYNRMVCFRLAASTFPNHVTEADCDEIACITDQLNLGRDDHYLTCRAILTRDAWECSRITDSTQAQTCTNNLELAMQRRCEYLTGAEEAICLTEGGITGGNTTTDNTDSNQSASGNQETSNNTLPREGAWLMSGQMSSDHWEGVEPSGDEPITLRQCGAGSFDYTSTTYGTLADICHDGPNLQPVSLGVFERQKIDATTGANEGFIRITVTSPTTATYYGETFVPAGTVFSEGTLTWQHD